MTLPKHKSFHFIVTRPNNRVTQLADHLKQLAYSDHTDNSIDDELQLKISHLPLITITDYFDSEFFKRYLVNEQSFNGVIFISGNAIDQAKKHLDDQTTVSQNSWKQLLKNPLYAIGEQTALLLKQELAEVSLNTQVYSPEQMNSEGLLALPQLAALQNQTWLIIKGVGGRIKLKEGLRAAGADVLELDVYQRQLPDLTTQKQIALYNDGNNSANNDKTRPIWLITSLQALDNLSRINKNRSLNCQLIVSSDRIAIEAVKMGFKVVAQSVDATDIQLVRCVQDYIESNRY